MSTLFIYTTLFLATYFVLSCSNDSNANCFNHNLIAKPKTKHCKLRHSKLRLTYYSNTSATLQLILPGDIQTNPGPTLKPKYPVCVKTVRSNQKQISCIKCFDTSHANCINLSHVIRNTTKTQYTCNNCLYTELSTLQTYLP